LTTERHVILIDETVEKRQESKVRFVLTNRQKGCRAVKLLAMHSHAVVPTIPAFFQSWNGLFNTFASFPRWNFWRWK